MPTKSLLTALLALVTLSGCGADLAQEDVVAAHSRAALEKIQMRRLRLPPQVRRTQMSSAPTYALKTTDEVDPTLAPTWMSSFSIYSTYALYVATEITGNLSGHHLATVYLIAPNGFVYQSLDASFATDVAPGAGEQAAEQTATGWRLWVSIPVAGTAIQQFSMSGTWQAEAWVDDASLPNAKGSFQLN